MAIAEQFPLEVSERIELLQDSLGVDFQTDTVALGALAEHVGAQLPEEPRVLLLNAGQKPNLPTATFFGDGRLPTVRDENDIVVHLLRRRFLDESTLTASVAQALIDRERAYANHRGKR